MPEPGGWWDTGLAKAGGAALAAILVWLGQRLIGRAAFQSALNDGFAKLATELRAELAEERKLRKEGDIIIMSLRGEIANLRQTIESMERAFEKGLPFVPAKRPPKIEDIIILGVEVSDGSNSE